MAIPSGGLISEIDFLNPACFTNGGTSVYDLTVNGNDFTLDSTSYTYNSTLGTLTLANTTNMIADTYMYTGNVPFTISYWMYFDSTTPDEHQFYNGCYAGDGWLTFHTLTGTTGFRFYINGGANDAPNGSLLDKQFNNITATFDGTTFYGYVNNVLRVTYVGAINQQRGPYPNFCFNDTGVNQGLKGLALVNFYNNALSPSNRTQLYNDGFERLGTINAPASYVDLLEPTCYSGTGLTINDLANPAVDWNISASGTTYDGTIGSIALTTQSIEANAQLINTGDGPITIAGWVNINQYSYGTSFNCIPAVGKALGGNQFKQIALYGSVPNAVGLGNCSNGSGFVYGNVESPINTWVFVVVKKNTGQTTSQYKTYINGLPNEAGSAGANVTTSIAYNGTFSYGLINGTIFGEGAANFPMKVSQYWMWNAYLSDSQVLDLYNATVNRYYPPVPIAEYDFQNGSYPGSGTTVFDLSGTGNTLAISSGGTWVSGTPNYFDLNGNTAIYKSPAIGGIASTNVFTLNAWYYLPTSVNNSVIFDVGSDGMNAQAHFGSGFGLGTLYGTGGFGLGVLELTGAAQPGWNFISYVGTGSGTTAYLNGASVGSTTNNPSLTSNTGICIGTNLNSSNPTQPRLDLAAVGRIGYASVFNVALNPSDILDIYNLTEGSYPSPPGPSGNGVGGRQFAQGFNG